MASRVSFKHLQEELRRRGLPIHGIKNALLERCRANGVSPLTMWLPPPHYRSAIVVRISGDTPSRERRGRKASTRS